jgi:hypothetical protein
MKKIILFTGLFLTATVSHLHAQSINNNNWKAFFGDPFNDTLIIHIHGDSSFVTKSSGEVLVRSKYTIAHDTLTISDYGTGEYTCPDMDGKYKINLNGDNLILTLIEDPCEGRANSISGLKWIKAPK